MRIALPIFAAVLAAAIPAQAQLDTARAGAPPVFVTSVTATYPDKNNKVPAINAVQGAAINTWSTGWPLAVLTHDQYYEYCVTVASATANGTASILYKIIRGKTVIQAAPVTTQNFNVVKDGTWFYCAGYHQLPTSPGAANLVGVLTYTPTGKKPEQTSLSVRMLLN